MSDDRVLQLSVDYRRSLVQMAAAGNYSLPTATGRVTESGFTVISGKGIITVTALLVSHKRKMSSSETIRAAEECGTRHAKIEELLALGEALPDLQRCFPIAALGSVVDRGDGSRLVASLVGGPGGRGIWLNDIEEVCNMDGWRFLEILC